MMMVESPCVKICELDAAGFCMGCGRSRNEIASWTSMSDGRKRMTVKAAAARLRDMRAGEQRAASGSETKIC
jgi:hypothetical protein